MPDLNPGTTPDPIDGADMPLPPALYPLICVGAGYFLNKYLPLQISGFLIMEPSHNGKFAAGILIAALALIGWAIKTMKTNNTTLLPHKVVTTLVTNGPFRFSRNPVYLGFTLLLLAVFFSTLNLWLAILLPLNIWLLQHHVILSEEKHLLGRFNSAYAAYQSKVRRWL